MEVFGYNKLVFGSGISTSAFPSPFTSQYPVSFLTNALFSSASRTNGLLSSVESANPQS